MNPEERKMLEETRALAIENREILRSIQRVLRVNAVFKALYWVIIIGATFGAYYFIQPYINILNGGFTEMTGERQSAISGESFTLGGAVENVKNLKSILKE
jgi:hypothetical protein